VSREAAAWMPWNYRETLAHFTPTTGPHPPS
jgi:hypothetical protein